MAKKIICLMLVIISLVSIAPVRVFAADENTVVSNIQVTDFVIPREGEDASALTPTLTLGEGYTLKSSKWFDSEDAAFTGTFEGGKTYRVNLHLLAEDGYEFAPNETVSATVNGGALTVSNISVGNYSRLNSAANVSVLFTVENNEAVINKIDITDFVIPREGEDASALTPTLTLGEGYTLRSSKWFDSEDAAFTGTFEGGKTYRVNLHLLAEEGYEFAPNESIAATVNGGALTVSNVTVGRYYRYNDVVNVSVLFTVEDDEHIISRIDMICDQGAIPFNTYYTEGKCYKVIHRDNVIKFVDPEPIADDGTDFGFANAMTGLSGSPENLDADTDYYIQCTVGLKDEYDWIETAKKDADSISQIQGLTVTFNGVQVTDSIYYYVPEINAIVFDIPIGKPDTEPVIESVNIIEEDFAMSQNSGHTFTAEVLGNEENKKVIWTVEGAQNPHNTIISVDGYLNISYDETAEFITVKATSEADPTKFDTVKITVLEKEPTIDLIIVEEPGELYPSDGAIMDVEVVGTQTNKDFGIRLSGNTSSKTQAEIMNMSAVYLRIGVDEKADYVTLEVYSLHDPSKCVEKKIFISKPYAHSNITINFKSVPQFNNKVTAKEFYDAIFDCVINDGLVINTNEFDLFNLTKGCVVPYNDEYLSQDCQYDVVCSIEPLDFRNGWIDSVMACSDYCPVSQVEGFSINTNGFDPKDAQIYYNDTYGNVYLKVFLGCPECIHQWNEGVIAKEPSCKAVGVKAFTCTVCGDVRTEDIPKLTTHSYSESVIKKATATENGTVANKCTVCGKVSSTKAIAKVSNIKLSFTKKNYTGSAISAPTLTVKDSNGKALVKGTDYTVTGLVSRTAVGRYKVTVTFKGNYSGTKTLYYTITPKAPSSVKVSLRKATGGYDDIVCSWTKATGASGYAVYYKKASASTYTLLGRTTGTSMTKKDLADGVKYTFKVVPYYTSNGTRYTSLASKTASIYTLKKIATPTVTASSGKAKVKWANINGESGYQISRSTSKTGTNIVSTYSTTSGNYKNVSATKGTTYYYKVRAYKVVNGTKVFGPWSSVKSFKR